MSDGTLARPPMGDAPPKPAEGSGRLRRYETRLARRRAAAKTEKDAKHAEYLRLKAIRFACYLRDHRRCRAFGTPLLFETDNLTKLAHSHHIIHKSAGGSDEAFNRATLSPRAHELHHAGQLTITGDGNGRLQFTLRDKKGIVLRVWEA